MHATLYYLLDGHIGTLVADGDVMHFHYDSYEQHLQFEVLNSQGPYQVLTQGLDIHNEVVEEAAILRHSAGWQSLTAILLHHRNELFYAII